MKKFLLISLAIVVILIVLIIAPKLAHYNAKAFQTAAKRNLKSLYAAELNYKNEHGLYADKFKLLKWKPERNFSYNFYLTDNEFYSDSETKLPYYFRPYVNKDSFAIFAVAPIYSEKPGGKLKYDIWFIDEKGNLKNIENGLY